MMCLKYCCMYVWHNGVDPDQMLRLRRRSEEYIFKIVIMAAILEFRSERFLAIFDLQVTAMLPTKFQVSWPFGSGEEAKNRFSRWPPPVGLILAIFDLQVILIFLPSVCSGLSVRILRIITVIRVFSDIICTHMRTTRVLTTKRLKPVVVVVVFFLRHVSHVGHFAPSLREMEKRDWRHSRETKDRWRCLMEKRMRMEKQKKLKHAPSATPYKQSRAVPTKSTTKPFVSVVARYHITPLTSFDTLRKHAYIILTPLKPPFYIVKWVYRDIHYLS